ncbi:hypothetical protein OROMI_001124 [Orobanche minor]
MASLAFTSSVNLSLRSRAGGATTSAVKPRLSKQSSPLNFHLHKPRSHFQSS